MNNTENSMANILAGNFEVKNPVQISESPETPATVQEQLKQRALASLGGSMVYVERNMLTWEG